MAYDPKVWKNKPDHSSPINAAGLNHMEQGIAETDANATAAKTEVEDVRTGADGTVYSNAGDAVRGQITATENQINVLNDVLGFNVECSIPEGYEAANFENSSHTRAFKYENDKLTMFIVHSAGDVSDGNLRLTLSNVGLSIGQSVSKVMTGNVGLKYAITANGNADKYNLELRFYNSSFNRMASDNNLIPLEVGNNKIKKINLTQYAEDNNIDLETYPNCVIMGIRWFANTATETQTERIDVYGFYDANEQDIVEEVEELKDAKVPFAKLDDDVVDYLTFTDARAIDFNIKNSAIWYVTEGSHIAGNVVNISGYSVTEFIPVEGIQKFNCSLLGSGGNVATVAYYNANREYISGLTYDSFDNVLYNITLNQTDLPANTAYIRFTMRVDSRYTQYANKVYGDVTLHTVKSDIIELGERVSNLEDLTDYSSGGYWAVCGDSITNANHESIYEVGDNDPFCPIDGYSGITYKRMNYAYYFAKRHNIQWANYGYGGTTLHHCDPKGYPNAYTNPFVDSRIQNFKSGIDWKYITIFFGWNDCAYGPAYQRDLWLSETYGEDIGYPVTNEQIGASGFATQAQKDACDAVTGTVGGVEYTDNEEYFFAKFVGTINDNVKTTWMGAWNYALDCLMRKYPNTKIMIVAPFVGNHSQMIKNSVHAIAQKWGVACFDFDDLPYWYYKTTPNTTPFAPESGNWKTGKGYNCPNTVEGYNRARFSWDNLHPSNLGYQMLADPFGLKLLES